MKQNEITRFGILHDVPNTTIDKDWVLSHILNAIFATPPGKELLVFKGGTCLRKCWIENYRFSEDLDFTLLDANHTVSMEWIFKVLSVASESSGALFHLEALHNQVWKDIPQGYLIEVRFWGADHHPNQKPLPPSRWQTMIHIDINHTELLLDEPVWHNIIHPYSDANMISSPVRTYSLAEMLAEKIRSLQQRNRPRDIYDAEMIRRVIHQSELEKVYDIFRRKCQSKSLDFTRPELFVNSDKQRINERHWNRALKHQISSESLPEFSSLYEQLNQFIKGFLTTR